MHEKNISTPDSSESHPSTVYARRLDFDPDPTKPKFEISEQSIETLPELTESQIAMMRQNPWASAEELRSMGLPVGDGVAAFRVRDEICFYNINPDDDYGTQVSQKNIAVVASEVPSTEEAQTSHEALLRDEIEIIGEEVLASAEVKPPFLELKEVNITRATEEIEKILAGDTSLSSALKLIGSSAEDIRVALDPNTGDRRARHAMLFSLMREMDVLGDMGKLPERVQDNDPRDLKTADASFNHDKKSYSPREYASRLALSMLDGSFDYMLSKQSRHDDFPDDHPHNGQHRQAAELVLRANYGESEGDDTDDLEHVADDELRQRLMELSHAVEDAELAFREIIDTLQDTKNMMYQDFIDSDAVVQCASRLTSTIDTVMSNLIRNQVNLVGIAETNLDDYDRTRVEGIKEELAIVVNTLDSLRNHDTLYMKLVHTLYEADEMNIVALRGYARNGSFDSLTETLVSVRARLANLPT